MSAAASGAAQAPVEVDRPDELELSCIVCSGQIGRQENVVYWPPAKNRPGVIAHKRCVAKEVSL